MVDLAQLLWKIFQNNDMNYLLFCHHYVFSQALMRSRNLRENAKYIPNEVILTTFWWWIEVFLTQKFSMFKCQ